MLFIHDYKNAIVAYLNDGKIVSAGDNKLIGLIVGHCVYNATSKLVGIYFKSKIMDTKGETIAEIETVSNERDTLPEKKDFTWEAWALLKKKEHTCSFIQEKATWSKNNFTDVLASV